MRILILSHYFWPETFRINALAVALKQQGHEVTVVTPVPTYSAGRYYDGFGILSRSREDYEGVDVIRVPVIPRRRETPFWMAANYLSAAFFATIVAPFRAGRNHDVVFAFQPSPATVAFPAIVMKAIMGKPLLLWIQDVWPETLEATGFVTSSWLLGTVGRLVRFMYRHCDQILISSRAFQPSVERLGVPEERIHYFPDAAEDLFEPREAPTQGPEVDQMPQGFRLMFAGNIGEAQDIPTIIEAAQALEGHQDLHFVFLGDGGRHQWLKDEVERRNLQKTVHILGRRPLETMPTYFSLASAMLVTLKKHPVFALTVPAKVEACLACARPIVAALDGEGNRILDEARAGLTCPSESPTELAETILEMYRATPERRAEMGRAGLAYSKAHFHRAKLLGDLNEWMEAACAMAPK